MRSTGRRQVRRTDLSTATLATTIDRTCSQSRGSSDVSAGGGFVSAQLYTYDGGSRDQHMTHAEKLAPTL